MQNFIACHSCQACTAWPALRPGARWGPPRWRRQRRRPQKVCAVIPFLRPGALSFMAPHCGRMKPCWKAPVGFDWAGMCKHAGWSAAESQYDCRACAPHEGWSLIESWRLRAGDLLAVPGAARPSNFGAGDVDEFLTRFGGARGGPAGPSMRGPAPGGASFAEFEAIYQGGRPDRLPGAFLPGAPGGSGVPAGLTPALHVRTQRPLPWTCTHAFMGTPTSLSACLPSHPVQGAFARMHTVLPYQALCATAPVFTSVPNAGIRAQTGH